MATKPFSRPQYGSGWNGRLAMLYGAAFSALTINDNALDLAQPGLQLVSGRDSPVTRPFSCSPPVTTSPRNQQIFPAMCLSSVKWRLTDVALDNGLLWGAWDFASGIVVFASSSASAAQKFRHQRQDQGACRSRLQERRLQTRCFHRRLT